MFKKLRKRAAVFFATAYAKRQYNKAVTLAEKMHAKEKHTYYVTLAPYNDNRLIVISRKEFKDICRKMQLNKERRGIAALDAGCFYRTKDRGGNNVLTPEDIYIRKMAFYRYILHRGGLL